MLLHGGNFLCTSFLICKTRLQRGNSALKLGDFGLRDSQFALSLLDFLLRLELFCAEFGTDLLLQLLVLHDELVVLVLQVRLLSVVSGRSVTAAFNNLQLGFQGSYLILKFLNLGLLEGVFLLELGDACLTVTQLERSFL